MKFSVNSIRSKIWLCVLIALVGYLVATMASFYTNLKQYQNLSHLQEEHYPQATLGSLLINTFELQAKVYEDAFLTGEQSLVIRANGVKPKMLEVIDNILVIVRKSSSPPIKEKEMLAIKEEYLAFAALAEKVYAHTGAKDLSRDDQKKIRELGQMQGALRQGLKSIASELDRALISQIEKDKKKSLYTVLLLGSLFITVMIFVGLIVDRVATGLLVTPLSLVLENIKRFSLGQSTIRPSPTKDSDEIGHLAICVRTIVAVGVTHRQSAHMRIQLDGPGCIPDAFNRIFTFKQKEHDTLGLARVGVGRKVLAHIAHQKIPRFI